jgi:hypothetical protein
LNVGKFIAHGKSDIQDEITFTITNNDKEIPTYCLQHCIVLGRFLTFYCLFKPN